MSLRQRFFRAAPVRALAAAAALACAACAYPQRNVELQNITAGGYRWSNLAADDMPDTLIVVTASGGGTRAAALELGALRALDKIVLASDRHLSDEVDLISSVSGGSVTASYFALHGREALAPSGRYDLEHDFIRRDGMRALIGAALNPVEWARLSTAGRERIDLLIDYFDETLFKDKETYGALLAARRRPFLVLNSADMVEGMPFPFTQDTFDLLCSDLARMKLSIAVAASAAFPVALSPVTLTNYSHCAAQDAQTDWPPVWVKSEVMTNWNNAASQDIVLRGRVEAAYAFGTPKKPGDSLTHAPARGPRDGIVDAIGALPVKKAYVHLLDGGIADNLGVSEPFRILTQQGMPAPFFNDIQNGRIKRILFVMVNARSAPSSALDAKPDTPGIIPMVTSAVGTAMDRATLGTALRLRTLLQRDFTDEAEKLEAANDPRAANFRAVSDNTWLVSVDFDAIPDALCRQRFHNIGTNWGMDPREVDAVLAMGEALVGADADFATALKALSPEHVQPMTTVGDACRIVPHNEGG